MLMMSFILIFIVLSVKSKSLQDYVDASENQKKEVLDKLELLTSEIRKSPDCENTLWNVDRDRNSVQVYFDDSGQKQEWFKVGEEHLTKEGERCVSHFARKWLSTIYLDPVRSKIAQLIVEGHTDSQRIMKSECQDSNGKDVMNFLCNLDLSQKRSFNTVKIMFEQVNRQDFQATSLAEDWDHFSSWRKRRLTATGRSFADPILIQVGEGSNQKVEDRERSRRVEFRFSMHGVLDRKPTSDDEF